MSEFIIIEEPTEIFINGEKYLLEEGDTLVLEEGIVDVLKEKAPQILGKIKEIAKEKGPEYAKQALEVVKEKGPEYLDEFLKAKARSAGAGETARAAANWLISAVKNNPSTAIEVAKVLNQAGYKVPAEFVA